MNEQIQLHTIVTMGINGGQVKELDAMKSQCRTVIERSIDIRIVVGR